MELRRKLRYFMTGSGSVSRALTVRVGASPYRRQGQVSPSAGREPIRSFPLLKVSCKGVNSPPSVCVGCERFESAAGDFVFWKRCAVAADGHAARSAGAFPMRASRTTAFFSPGPALLGRLEHGAHVLGRLHAELAEHRGAVHLDRSDGDAEPLGHLPVDEALREQPGDVPFP